MKAKKNNQDIRNLLKDFFAEEPQEIAVPSPQKKDAPLKPEDMSSLINDLLAEDISPPPIPESIKKEAVSPPKPVSQRPIIPVIKPESPQQNTPKSLNPRMQEMNTRQANHLSQLQSNNVEGGASSAVINPAQTIGHSREVDDILSFAPGWLISSGITAIGFILLGIMVMSYFIKYPDIVNGQITITSSNPPATIISKSNGALFLFKNHKEEVEEGDAIALIKNDAKYEDVETLKKSLDALSTKLNRGSNLNNFSFPKNLDLGGLQGAFSELVFSLKNQQLQNETSFDNKERKKSIDRRIEEINKIEGQKKQQIAILKKEYERARKVYGNRYVPLFKNGSISKEQLESKQSEVTQKLNIYEDTKSGLSEYRKRVLDLQAQKDELDYATNETNGRGFNTISSAFSKLINAVNTWENQYLLTAPISGNVNYLKFVKNNVHAKFEQEIASIVPPTDENIENMVIGEMFVPATGVGKVEIGQTVNIELDAYMKKEYGVLLGEITEMSDIGTTIASPAGPQLAYRAVVDFQEGFQMTTKKEIIFKHNMKGKAEVITKDVRLIERFFNELRAVADAK